MNNYSYHTPPGHPGAYYPSYSATSSPAASPSGGQHGYYARPGSGPIPSPRHHARHTSSGDAYGYSSPRGAPFSPRYNSSGHYATAANAQAHAYREEIPVYEQYQPSRRRRQSSSTPQRPSSRQSSSHPKKPPPVAKATEADARKHRIPPGYSLKNWDPSEEPIMLLGSVFDANSLGKWIYDWTVYHHGPATPIADMAGELWLLLIQLAGKVKRAEESMGRIRTKENKEMVDDFIESGERLTDKLKRLLKSCETPMLKAGKKHSKDSAQLGKNAGTEFVDSIFGRDRQLEGTEKFMSAVRLWNLRFDANCEDILRRPGQ
ncbi:vegetative cell wall protein gp1 [Diplocarpon rosae]|nr:vegetative cell wall protein gp1 [Diplocarpon rosae]